ncbi:MAG: hypothetical protein EPO63_09495 [Candidatus Nitrosotenuis sp.]|nr:MAG: hypothetical protein EPO63_09495 [Candidatus Nitrosotenuis sp.]
MKNNAVSFIIAATIVGILVSELFAPSANSTEIGKEKQPMWHFGEGLKSGDSFEYSICDYLLAIPISPDHCYTITLQAVALLPTPQGNMWVISAHVDHHIRKADFILLVSDSSFKITTDGISIPYADSLERTLEWAMNFASTHRPQPLVIGRSWGVVASDTVPETELDVMQVDSIQMGEKIIPTYKIGYSLIKDSFLQIKDGFPIPIKAVIYKPTSAFKEVPLAATFELLNYSNGNDYVVAQTDVIPFDTYQRSSPYQTQDSQQKTDTVANHTAGAKSESGDSKAEYDQPTQPDDIMDSNESSTDIETETFDENNFQDKLKNSTTDQVLKSLYGQDYEKIITSFDKFIELLTNATNTIVKNQFNSTSPQHEK